MKEKIIFFLQSKFPVGGSIYQFLSFAAYLAQTGRYDVFYVNTRFGKVEERYQNSGIGFYDPTEIDASFFENALIFTPYNYLFYLLAKLNSSSNAKICLYFYHPNALKFLSSQILPFLRDDVSLVQMLKKNEAYCFMDRSNYLSVFRQTKINLERRYVPITLHFKPIISAINQLNRLQNSQILNIGWLGRLDGDKIFSVINTADNLIKIKSYDKINFHLIGDGNCRDKIQLEKYFPKIKFIFNSYLYDEERDEYIKKNIDLMIAMGISAVDSTMLGIPTLIPIVSSKRFYSDLYAWPHDITEYSLGSLIEDIGGDRFLSLEEAITELKDPCFRQKIIEDGKNYCVRAFAIDNSVGNLLKFIHLTTLTYNQAVDCPIVKNQLRLYRLYSFIFGKSSYPEFHQFISKLTRLFALSFRQKISVVISRLLKNR